MSGYLYFVRTFRAGMLLLLAQQGLGNGTALDTVPRARHDRDRTHRSSRSVD